MARPASCGEVRISAQQARNLQLAVQGLLTPPRARATRARLLATIARMRLLQIDTINVVARSPYLVLFSRLGHYEPHWLDEALARGKIFECWAHEACFVAMSDYALHRGQFDARARHWAHQRAARMHREHRASMDKLLAHIRDNGAVKSSDFERKAAAQPGWWEWKDEKRWLEAWFALGELMIARRDNFQRVYDLTERVLAHAKIDATLLPAADTTREFMLGAVRALGITQARWINDYFRSRRKLKDADLDALVGGGELVRVTVRGWDKPGFVHRDNLPLLARAQRSALRATHTTLLSPFDPVVWDRERALAMFGFDYRLECYTPAHKRRFGYFTLPILHRGQLIGRLDAKAHRDDGVFEIKSIHLESGIEADDGLVAEVAAAIQACADWHAASRIVIRKSDPAAFAKRLRMAITSPSRAPPAGRSRPASETESPGGSSR
ncbi:MAG: YcaQ family DNA glycosylase [Proteobacteria bacterium]|nr:YcaQ family DNA glycosylase [Pseudomonadota bacterium]